ncbi:MAG: hypothetical protein IH616_24310 [Gemmatimonadales bacterium]|nr:hypothetical protein [Gemmatimonadales bacterium]
MTATIMLFLGFCFGDVAHRAYAAEDPEGLRALVEFARTREDTLLLRYRLYALTQRPGLIIDIPSDLDSASARELALLSALWGYRTRDLGLLELYVVGRRTMGLLERALELDPEDPLVMLIDAQSLLFRPAIAGGSKRGGLERLRALQTRVHRTPACGVSRVEADAWLWYALDKNNDPAADSLRAELQSQPLPQLYRRFLADPP